MKKRRRGNPSPADLPDYHGYVAFDVSLPETGPSIVGTPVAKVDRYSGAVTTYQRVVEWTVATGMTGVLKEVSMVSTNFEKTMFRLTIAGTVQFEDKIIQTSLSLPFPENNRLEAGQKVTLEVKSSDGTSITVDGSITGKEV